MAEETDGIEFKRIDDKEERIEETLDLLHNYLREYISRGTLKSDIEYCFKKGRAFAALDEDKIIGAVVGVDTPFFDKFHIGHIAVKEKYQGRGIGSTLIEKIIPEDSGASVHLNVDNPKIERFYKRLDFVETHKRFKRPSKKEENVKPSD